MSEMTLHFQPCNQAPTKAGVEHALDADRKDNKSWSKAEEVSKNSGGGRLLISQPRKREKGGHD